MRSSFAVSFFLLVGSSMLSGCGSSWGGDPFPQLGAVPHWPDCDEDGWGAPYQLVEIDGEFIRDDLMQCKEVGAAPEDCPFVQNNLDCDDGYADSGADLTGQGCPSSFSWIFGESSIGPSDYLTANNNIREFLVFLPDVGRLEAKNICGAWAHGLDIDEESPVSFTGGVASLDDANQRVAAEGAVAGFGEQTLWVAAHFSADSDHLLVWSADEDGAEVPLELEFCDGAPLDEVSMLDMLPIPSGLTDADQALIQYRSTMLLPIQFGNRLCVVRPTEQCAGYSAAGEIVPEVCPRYGALCERAYRRPTEFFDYQFAGGFCETDGEG